VSEMVEMTKPKQTVIFCVEMPEIDLISLKKELKKKFPYWELKFQSFATEFMERVVSSVLADHL